jgi:hypothetical protein
MWGRGRGGDVMRRRRDAHSPQERAGCLAMTTACYDNGLLHCGVATADCKVAAL